MGRPLNKRFFGNRNIGTTGTGDNGIGGEGLAAYTLAAEKGSIEVDSNSGQPTLVIPAPSLPGGVQATASVVWEVASISIIAGTNDSGTGYVDGETVTFTGATGVTATVTVVADDITAFTIVNRGSFTTITPSESFQVIGAVGNDAQAEITWRVKSITTVEKGSGYTSVPSLSWAAGVAGPVSGTAPGTPTVALTTDSGALNTTNASTNQQNAIVAYAQTTSDGSNLIGDIVKQVSGRRYKVKTADGTAICKLVTDGVANAVGEMTITATDSNGNTYYVSKLTRHKATLVRLVDDGSDGDWLYANNGIAPWSFAAASGNTVQIANA